MCEQISLDIHNNIRSGSDSLTEYKAKVINFIKSKGKWSEFFNQLGGEKLEHGDALVDQLLSSI